MRFSMEESGEHAEKQTGRQILGRILQRYLPAENSQGAALIKRLSVVWRVGKILLVMVGMLVIGRAAQLIGAAHAAIPPILFKGLGEAAAYFTPLFLELIVTSLTYLWLPILAYVLIAVLTKSPFWRTFWCLVGVAGCFLVFVAALKGFSWPALGGFSWSALKEFSQSVFKKFSWEEDRVLLLPLIQGYLFTLWFLPREIWNIVGLTISVMLGLMILILPDLPTAFDDFGMFGAVLAFFLGYLNALASLIQRVVRRL